MRDGARPAAVLRCRVVPLLAALLLAVVVTAGPRPGSGQGGVDTALVVSADVSNSVDEHRYRLQMEGIAAALEDPGVIDAITSGPQGGILFSMVVWADRPKVAIPWQRIASRADALAAAQMVRTLPRHDGEFTCMARMLQFVSDKVVSQLPVAATRIIVDVSGDGSDNCNPQNPIDSVRKELLATGRVTVNGLPILEGREAATLAGWYRDHVMGGPGAFILPADGFADFGRAIRQKFVVEVSFAGAGRRRG